MDESRKISDIKNRIANNTVFILHALFCFNEFTPIPYNNIRIFKKIVIIFNISIYANSALHFADYWIFVSMHFTHLLSHTFPVRLPGIRSLDSQNNRKPFLLLFDLLLKVQKLCFPCTHNSFLLPAETLYCKFYTLAFLSLLISSSDKFLPQNGQKLMCTPQAFASLICLYKRVSLPFIFT